MTSTDNKAETSTTVDDLFIETPVDTPVTFNLKASDPEHKLLWFFITKKPNHGILLPDDPKESKRTYTPTKGFKGADSFSYTASPNGKGDSPSNQGNVSIFVTPIIPMSRTSLVLLVTYFIVIIVASMYFIIDTWHPGINSQYPKTTVTTTTYGPAINESITMLTNQTAKVTENTISWKSSAGKGGEVTSFKNVTVTPLVGNDAPTMFTNKEIRLVILAAIFGALGACVHAIASLAQWIGRNKATKGWEGWYVTRPFIGAALGIMTYLVLRAGFISGGPTAVDDFAVAAIGALVGLMNEQITQKLRDVFNALFGVQKPPQEKGEDPAKTPSVD